MFRRIRHHGLVGLLVGLLGWIPLWAAETGEADRVPRLIRDLGSSQYGQREEAMKQLDTLGTPALAALREATQTDDLEVRRRCQALVERIEKRVQSAQLLEPRRVHLVFKDTPIAAAVADFSRKTGYHLQLQRNSTLPPNRTVTLDTGEVSFWEALEQFCDKAGVAEQNRVSPLRSRPAPTDANRTFREQELRILLREEAMLGINNPNWAPSALNLTLVPGKAPALPTAYSGAIRIQALSPELCVVPTAKSPDHVQVVLEVAPEPKLDWKKVVDIRIEHAVDDNGQTLGQLTHATKPLAEHDLDMRAQMMLSGRSSNQELFSRSIRQIPVALKAGPNYPRSIRELKGTISALVLTPPEALVTIDDVLKATGTTARAKDGSDVKVVEARRDGRSQLHLQLELPGWFGRWTNEQQVVNRRVRMGRMLVNPVDTGHTVGAMTWSVQDARGARLSLARMETRFSQRDSELFQENFLTFYAPGSQEGPFKCVLTGQRLVILDVPFTLKDIPVP